MLTLFPTGLLNVHHRPVQREDAGQRRVLLLGLCPAATAPAARSAKAGPDSLPDSTANSSIFGRLLARRGPETCTTWLPSALSWDSWDLAGLGVGRKDPSGVVRGLGKYNVGRSVPKDFPT